MASDELTKKRKLNKKSASVLLPAGVLPVSRRGLQKYITRQWVETIKQARKARIFY